MDITFAIRCIHCAINSFVADFEAVVYTSLIRYMSVISSQCRDRMKMCITQAGMEWGQT